MWKKVFKNHNTAGEDRWQLDTTGEYMTIGGKLRHQPVVVENPDEEAKKQLFFSHTWFLLNHKDISL